MAAAKSLVTWLDAYHGRLGSLPPMPAGNNHSFGFSGGIVDFAIPAPPMIRAPTPFPSVKPPAAAQVSEIETPTTPGGLLGTLGSIFGAGQNRNGAVPAVPADIPAPQTPNESNGINEINGEFEIEAGRRGD